MGNGRRLVSIVALAGAVGLGALAWSSSRLPAAYSVMDMGAGPAAHAAHGVPAGGASLGGRGVSLTSFRVDPARIPDVVLRLVARAERFEVAGGRAMEGYTLDGTSPGPTIRVTEGQLVEVTLVNESVADGTTLHWHGLDVPNSQDGVAGVTQDAVPVGGSFTYRFVADQVGTYWYHSHQVSHEQVRRGLFGALVVQPRTPAPAPPGEVVAADELAVLHLHDGQPTLNGRVGDGRVVVDPGELARVRVVNTDDALTTVWASGPIVLAAVDGTDLHSPTAFRDKRIQLTAGARADLLVRAPADGSGLRVHIGAARSVVVGPAGSQAPVARQPGSTLDLLVYGSPAPLGLDATRPARTYDYVIGRRPGLLDGRPGLWWTINGRMFPDVPMFVVREGEVVRFRIVNETAEGHPMHLHGHHVVVLSRDGVAATGSPWWTDSLEVAAGETYEVALLADNPGIWMDHCHNLPHAMEGLVAHLAYEDVTTPFLVHGPHANQPE
jgi:FtsP/CotA-like multicopper oxidase with cupredoxin domain